MAKTGRGSFRIRGFMNPNRNDLLKRAVDLGDFTAQSGVLYCAGKDNAPRTPDDCRAWCEAFMIVYRGGVCKGPCVYSEETYVDDKGMSRFRNKESLWP
jgi:hypothetical protein